MAQPIKPINLETLTKEEEIVVDGLLQLILSKGEVIRDKSKLLEIISENINEATKKVQFKGFSIEELVGKTPVSRKIGENDQFSSAVNRILYNKILELYDNQRKRGIIEQEPARNTPLRATRDETNDENKQKTTSTPINNQDRIQTSANENKFSWRKIPKLESIVGKFQEFDFTKLKTTIVSKVPKFNYSFNRETKPKTPIEKDKTSKNSDVFISQIETDYNPFKKRMYQGLAGIAVIAIASGTAYAYRQEIADFGGKTFMSGLNAIGFFDESKLKPQKEPSKIEETGVPEPPKTNSVICGTENNYCFDKATNKFAIKTTEGKVDVNWYSLDDFLATLRDSCPNEKLANDMIKLAAQRYGTNTSDYRDFRSSYVQAIANDPSCNTTLVYVDNKAGVTSKIHPSSKQVTIISKNNSQTIPIESLLDNMVAMYGGNIALNQNIDPQAKLMISDLRSISERAKQVWR